MIKMQALLTKLPDITLEQFDKHWHKPHGDLTRNITVIRHAVQNARLTEADDLTTCTYHGMPSVWFDNLDDALGMESDPGFPESYDDQAHFMDRSKLKYLVLEERAVDGEVGPGDGEGISLIQLVKRSEGSSIDAFAADWPEDADRERGRSLGATRHIVSRPLPESYEGDERPAYDAVRELFFVDLESLRAAKLRDPETWDELFSPSSIDSSGSQTYVARQRRLF